MLILLALGPIASKIPAAVLAGILMTVGIGVMDYKGLKAIPSLPKDINLKGLKLSSEVLIMLVVLILSTFWNLVNAVGIGLVIASLMFMKKMGDFSAKRSTVSNLAELPWADEIDFPTKLKEEVFIKHLDGPLFFGVTGEIKSLADQIPNSATHFLIRMDKVPYLDQSGVYTLEDIFLDLAKKDVKPLLVNVQDQPKYMMERIGLIPNLIDKKQIFSNIDDAIAWVKSNVKDEG